MDDSQNNHQNTSTIRNNSQKKTSIIRINFQKISAVWNIYGSHNYYNNILNMVILLLFRGTMTHFFFYNDVVVTLLSLH